jgi:hypothetical protein
MAAFLYDCHSILQNQDCQILSVSYQKRSSCSWLPAGCAASGKEIRVGRDEDYKEARKPGKVKKTPGFQNSWPPVDGWEIAPLRLQLS